MLTDLERARADFSNFPPPIFDSWIALNVADYGWPDEKEISPRGARWRHYILHQRPRAWWASIEWKLIQWKPDLTALIPDSASAVQDVFEFNVYGRLTHSVLYVGPEESAKRFASAHSYFCGHGIWPGGIPIVEEPRGWWLLDGTHRFAAFLKCEIDGTAKPMQPIYLGRAP
jgi:hypothetical protein